MACGELVVGEIVFRYTGSMAKVVDPRNLPDQNVFIPGLKPPVRDFVPSDDSDPSEVDAFNHLIRQLRNQPPEAQTDRG
jgi:hypothetical protein